MNKILFKRIIYNLLFNLKANYYKFKKDKIIVITFYNYSYCKNFFIKNNGKLFLI